MKDESGIVEKLLAGLQPPKLPSGLQGKVLSGAKDALSREAARDVWSRIWESRPLRITWASAVVVLVVCNIGINGVRSSWKGPAAPNPTRSLAEASGGPLALAHLPRLDERVRPLIGAETYRLVEEGESIRPPRPKGKEKTS